MVVSLVMSFTNYNPIQADATCFVAFQNYGRTFTIRRYSMPSASRCGLCCILVPLSIILPLGLALLVNAKQLLGRECFPDTVLHALHDPGCGRRHGLGRHSQQ